MRTCDNCGKELEYVFPDIHNRRSTDNPNFMEAMTITFGGGFGMYFDNESGEIKYTVCGDCTELVIQGLPSHLEQIFTKAVE